MLSLHKKKILILGGEGFIGRNIADELQCDYDCYSVGLMKSLFSQDDRNDTYIPLNPYKSKINGVFDVVIHLIDNAVSVNDFEHQEMQLLDNIQFSEAAQLILFSSAVLYANPTSEYAQRKKLLESILSQFSQKNNINLAIFRLFNIFGKYQMPFRQGSFVANVLCNHLTHVPTEVFDMNARRDFMFAGDMAKFVRVAIETSFAGLTDLGTQQLLTLGDVIMYIEENAAHEKIDIIDKSMKELLVCPLANNALIESVKTTPLKQGLVDTYEFYKNNIGIINNK